MTEDLQNKRRKTVKIILIIVTIIFTLAIIPGVAAAGLSLMIFEKGTSAYLVWLYTFIATFPVICFLSLVSWIFFRIKKYGLAVFISLMPLLNIIVVAILLIFSAVFYRGRF